MRGKQGWREMSPTRRKIVVAASAIELALTAIALNDLRRRPAGLVRGPKRMWSALCLVQPVGPIAYLLFGRR